MAGRVGSGSIWQYILYASRMRLQKVGLDQ
jgi:hypothetical protein